MSEGSSEIKKKQASMHAPVFDKDLLEKDPLVSTVKQTQVFTV